MDTCNQLDYDELYRNIKKIIRHYRLDEDDESEITQRIAVKFWDKCAKNYRNEGSFYSYLKTIIRNEFIDYIREGFKRKDLRDKKKEYITARKQNEEVYEKALEKYQQANDLSDQQREALEMYADGFKTKEIANKLNVKQSTVRTQIYRMRKKV